jgi:hypothetical protein
MSHTAEFALRLSGVTLAVAVAMACSTPAGPSGHPRSVLGSVTGIVRGEKPLGSRIFRAHPPLPDAEVTVITGRAAGLTTRTRADGSYAIEIPPGSFKLRFTHPGFQPHESSDTVMPSTGEVAMPEVALPTAPWTLTGVVTDSIGNRVPDVDVTVRPGDAFFSTYGTVKTGTDGHYRFASSRPHWNYVLVSASRSGFESFIEQGAGCCNTESDTVYDLRLVRVISVTPTAPSVLRVGESVPIPASVIRFDNGETRNIFVLPTSNASSVVTVSPGDSWYAMRGVSAGVAVLTFDHRGTTAAHQVRVIP